MRAGDDVAQVQRLWATLESAEVQQVREVEIGRSARRAPRRARLALRYARVEILPPRSRMQGQKRAQAAPRVPLWAVLVREEEAPEKEESIEWLLLSTRPLESADEAWRATEAYARRWLIERYHYVWKSGCGVEQLQLETAERLERALALYAIVAWRLLWLSYAARTDAEQPCTVALEPAQWQALYVHHRRPPPPEPPSLGVAVRWIAELGGFVGTKAQPPGVKTLWRGWRRLEDLTHGYLLARDVGNA